MTACESAHPDEALRDAGRDAIVDGQAETDAGDAGACPPCWRSSLYPEDWTPAFADDEGRFVHDFSWAGYHHGEVEPPTEPPGTLLSVLDHGADPDGELDSTEAIQAVLDEASARGGAVVVVPSGLYRCEGLLTVGGSGVVLRGQGPDLSRLYFTSDGNMSNLASLTFRAESSVGADLPLTEDAIARSREVKVADAAGLAPGDDVELGAVISAEFVAEHAMTGTWEVSVGQWRAFFRRTVVEVEGGAPPHTVRLDVPVRYPLRVRDGASMRRVSGLLSEVGVEDLGLANAVSLAGARSCDRAHVLALVQVKDAWVRRVASFASPAAEDGDHLQSGGILIERSMRVTVSDSSLALAQNRGSGGNGYLFEIQQSGEVLLRDCAGTAGRHNFIQNWDFGTSGCVFLRVRSQDGLAEADLANVVGLSEYHHSLAMANLVDGADSNDGWAAVNRGQESTGAGHTATQNVFWNVHGGRLRSYQFGWGYVIGTRDVQLFTDPADDVLAQLTGLHLDTEPLDFVEGAEAADTLRPTSLYEDQLARRLGSGE